MKLPVQLGDGHLSEKITLHCGHLTLKSMWTIERLSQHPSLLTCKVLHEFVLVDKLSSFSQDGLKGSGRE